MMLDAPFMDVLSSDADAASDADLALTREALEAISSRPDEPRAA
jgi:hypothetical protein